MKPLSLSAVATGALTIILYGAAASAADVRVTMNKVDPEGVGEPIGTVTLRDSSELGLLILPDLKGLPPGAHGFHLHENPDCAPMTKEAKHNAAGAAGGHLDPQKTGRHAGPVGAGHLGDLPQLLVDDMGNARMAMVVPRLQVPDVVGHSLMIHAGGDNYSDQPQPLGGGGPRIACGVITVDSM